jgi:hypothetical protein
MRNVLGAGVIGVVAGGVILWLLEPYKDRFPEGWEAVYDLAWAPMPLPRLVVAIAVLAIGFLLLEYSANGREYKTHDKTHDKTQDKTQSKTQESPRARDKAVAVAIVNGPAKLEPSFDTVTDQKMDRMSLTDDEETVLSSLARFPSSVDAAKLQQSTGLNERRFDVAVGNLRSRSFIDDVPLNEGRSIAFKQDGRRYAIKHKLGQKLVA